MDIRTAVQRQLRNAQPHFYATPAVQENVTRQDQTHDNSHDFDLLWEQEVYENDPTGGQPSRY